jgi:mannose-6-phosphate isomerase-like protein (cupin superfamily)
MNYMTYDEFRQLKLAQGYEQVLEREWEALLEYGAHKHAFDTDALVVRGEFWLTVDDQTRHMQAGDTFTMPRGVVHSERYGPEGATFWAARKN